MRTTSYSLATCMLIPALGLLIGCGQTVTPPPANHSEITVISAPGVAGGVMSIRDQINARVTAKDDKKRTLTLLGNDAKEQTVDIPESAVNFPQIKVGDLIIITRTEEIAAVVLPAGIPIEQGEAAVIGLPDQGQKPGGVIGAVTQIRAKVTAIDDKARTATIVTDAGKKRVLPVRQDIDLKRHQVGDQVVMRITTMIEIDVQAPAPKP